MDAPHRLENESATCDYGLSVHCLAISTPLAPLTSQSHDFGDACNHIAKVAITKNPGFQELHPAPRGATLMMALLDLRSIYLASMARQYRPRISNLEVHSPKATAVMVQRAPMLRATLIRGSLATAVA